MPTPDVEAARDGATITLARLKRINRNNGGHWFSPESMRFFDSRIVTPDAFMDRSATRAYFVTSEQFHGMDGTDGDRMFTVRRMTLADGRVETVGRFQQYPGRWEAIAAAARAAADD